jgi:hypothetical protein
MSADIDWLATSISKSGSDVKINCEDGAMAEEVFDLITSLAEASLGPCWAVADNTYFCEQPDGSMASHPFLTTHPEPKEPA